MSFSFCEKKKFWFFFMFSVVEKNQLFIRNIKLIYNIFGQISEECFGIVILPLSHHIIFFSISLLKLINNFLNRNNALIDIFFDQNSKYFPLSLSCRSQYYGDSVIKFCRNQAWNFSKSCSWICVKKIAELTQLLVFTLFTFLILYIKSNLCSLILLSYLTSFVV